MNSMNFNQEWYGSQAKVLTQAPDCIVVDYGCNGRGIVKNYNLFEGIQLCFLDFNTDETMVSKKFNSDYSLSLWEIRVRISKPYCVLFAGGLFWSSRNGVFANFFLFSTEEIHWS